MIKLSIGFLIGLIFSVVIAACATNPFPYDYYTVDLTDQKLLGPSSGAYPDLPLSACAPSETSKAPCIGLLTPTFEQLQKAYLDLQDQLIACQKQVQLN